MSKAIYKLHFQCGKGEILEGVFIAEKDDVAEMVESGKYILFGEAQGKHSNVYGPIELDEDLTFVTDDQAVIKMFEDYKLFSGYNPIDLYKEQYDEG